MNEMAPTLRSFISVEVLHMSGDIYREESQLA